MRFLDVHSKFLFCSQRRYIFIIALASLRRSTRVRLYEERGAESAFGIDNSSYLNLPIFLQSVTSMVYNI